MSVGGSNKTKKKLIEKSELSRSDNSANYKQKNKWVLISTISAIILALVVVSIATSNYLQQKEESLRVQNKLETYLQNKYDQDFVVELPSRSGYGFAIEGVHKANAYPVDNPNIRFIAETSAGYTRDFYYTVLWDRDAEQFVSSAVKAIYGNDANYDTRVQTPSDNKVGRLSFSDGLKNGRISITVTINSNETIETTGKTVVAERLYSLAQALRGQNIKVFHLRYLSSGTGSLNYDQGPAGSTAETVEELTENIREDN